MSERQRGNYAFLFQGQGAQSAGMFSELHSQSAVARRVFSKANELVLDFGLPYNITDVCFGKETSRLSGETLDPTAVQLAMVTGQVATLYHLVSNGVLPAAINAGLSLGQLTAAHASGFIPKFEIVLDLTYGRAQIMEKYNEIHKLGVAIINDRKRQYPNLVVTVRDILAGLEGAQDVVDSLRNTAHQIGISGPKLNLGTVIQPLREQLPGAVVMFMPKIQGSHHPLMEGATREYRGFLETFNAMIRKPALEYWENITGGRISEISAFISSLAAGLSQPVSWDKTLHGLSERGIDYAVEYGPAELFGSMAAVECPSVTVLPTNNMKTVDVVIDKLAVPSRRPLILPT